MEADKKQKLEAEKAELESQIKELETKSTNYGSDIDGGDEESHETDETGLNLSMIQTLKARLEEVEEALRND